MFRVVLKYIVTPLILLIGVFAIVLYIQNGKTLIVTMQNDSNIVQSPQIYYKFNNEPYSEKKSIHFFKYQDNRYYFKLPNYKSIKEIRFDPSVRALNIKITDIKLIDRAWFKESVYTLPLTLLNPANQVEIKSKSKDSISFTTNGKDPQLIANFNLEKEYSRVNFYINQLATTLLITLFLLFLYKIYKTYQYSDSINAKLILYALFFALTIFKVYYYKDSVQYGYPPDEAQHFGYVKYVHNHHNFVPKFEDMPLYLSHPPLYYELMNLVYDEQGSKELNVDNFRTLSIKIFLLAFMLILYIGFKSKLSILGHFVYLSLITSIPMHAYIGASISNDNLAILGAIVFIFGFKRVLEERYSFATYFLLGLGAFLAYFAKLTAALLIFFVILYYIFYMLKIKKWIKIDLAQIAILILFIVPILYYQLSIMQTYHSLVPTYNVTHPKAFLHSSFYTPPEHRVHLSLIEWFYRMVHYIKGGWFNIHSHHSFGKDSIYGYLGLLILHIFALIALFLKCPKEDKIFCLLGKFTILSLFSVLIVQFFFSYKAHLANGYLGGLQPRYVLPFMFSFAIMASLFVERFKKSFLAVCLVVAISIHALYSDFFYFLQYYK